MQRFASGVGLIPEQDWEYPDLAASPFGTDPTVASIGFQNGRPGGVGRAADVVGRVVRPARRRPRQGQERRAAEGDRAALREARARRDDADGHEPGGQELGLRLAGHRHRHDGAGQRGLRRRDEHRPDLRDGDGLDDRGVRRLLQRRRAGERRNDRAQRRRGRPEGRDGARACAPSSSISCRERSCSTSSDPNGDDNGPGTYAYPTSADFHAGAFDIQRFQVYDAGSDVVFRLQTRDLTPTFGSPLGAQLVDVYVHEPGAAPTSTSAANGTTANRNYSIAPASAWSRLIQVQGFGQRYRTRAATRVGTMNISANEISRFITFQRLEGVARRTPGSRLGIHGRAHRPGRLREPTRRAASSRRRRTSSSASARRAARRRSAASPASQVPKAVDVLTPPGVSQATELDPTLGPVVLQGVTIS